MTSRERVLTALDGGTPDRVPCALAFYHVDPKRFVGNREPVGNQVDVHGVELSLSREDRALARQAEQLPYDTRLGSAQQVVTYRRWGYRPESARHRNPLAQAETLDELRAYPLPDTTRPYQPRRLRKAVDAAHADELAVSGSLPHLGGELFESAWRLRGLEAFLLDLVERPDWADYLLDRLLGFARRNAQALAAAGVDILALDDDVGMPGPMFMSPALWRRFFKPRMAAIIAAARAVKPALRVLYHSEGAIDPIIGDLIEIGVNALNPLQPEHIDAASVRRTYGTRLALWGTVGRQTTFSFASPREIHEEVELRVDTLGRAGLVLCPAYDIDEPDIPRENVLAFLDAVRRYG
jgi:uroporphyrinogen decarboxylase